MVFSEKSKKFDITYNSMTLEFEFYTKEFIQKKLEELKEDKKILHLDVLIFLIKELVFLKLRKNIQMNKVMKNIIFFLILNFLSMTKKNMDLLEERQIIQVQI